MTRKLPVVAGVAILLVTVVCSWSWRRVRAQGTMRTIGIPEAGLALIGPGDPDFDHLASSVLGGGFDPEFDAQRDYSVILHNQSEKRVVAYAVRWEYTEPDGKRISVAAKSGWIKRLLDGGKRRADAGDDRYGPALLPHAWVIILPYSGYKKIAWSNTPSNWAVNKAPGDPRYMWYVSHFVSRFSQATDLEAMLDGAFFEDGSFVGPDKSGLFGDFKSELTARQNLVSYILRSAQRGRDLDDVAKEIQASFPSSPPAPRELPGGPPDWSEYHKYFYTKLFLMAYSHGGRDMALRWAQDNLFQQPPELKKTAGSRAGP